MASNQLVPIEDDGNSLGLSERQVQALVKLEELGAEPAPWDEEKGKFIYSANPQIRALQLVFEGRFGGSGRGQGRPKQPRAAEVLAEEIRDKLQPRLSKALRRALAKEAGVKANLEAIKLSIDIERGERKLQLEEEARDDDIGDTKEEIIGALIELVSDPATAAAIEGSAVEITDAEVVNEDDTEEADAQEAEEAKPVYNFEKRKKRRTSASKGTRSERASSRADSNGNHDGKSVGNGARQTKRDRSASTNPLTKAALRRAAERR